MNKKGNIFFGQTRYAYNKYVNSKLKTPQTINDGLIPSSDGNVYAGGLPPEEVRKNFKKESPRKVQYRYQNITFKDLPALKRHMSTLNNGVYTCHINGVKKTIKVVEKVLAIKTGGTWSHKV